MEVEAVEEDEAPIVRNVHMHQLLGQVAGVICKVLDHAGASRDGPNDPASREFRLLSSQIMSIHVEHKNSYELSSVIREHSGSLHIETSHISDMVVPFTYNDPDVFDHLTQVSLHLYPMFNALKFSSDLEVVASLSRAARGVDIYRFDEYCLVE